MGDLNGPGYLEETMQNVVRDSVRNYWLSQRGTIKVFRPDGSFVREVGRRGQGPMEFEFPRPMWTDGAGNVHVFDRNLRETVLDRSFVLYDENAAPTTGIERAVALNDSVYVINHWVPTADQLGLPMHLVQDGQIKASFGAPVNGETQSVTEFSSRRVLTTDKSGRIYSARFYDYTLDVWTQEGRRIVGFVGPQLNEHPVQPAAFSRENPAPNTIMAIHADADGLVWVVSWQRRSNWLDSMEEKITPRGDVVLAPKSGLNIQAIFESRIDIIDLNKSVVIARSSQPELFFAFVGDDLLEAHYSEDGTPQLASWKVTYKAR